MPAAWVSEAHTPSDGAADAVGLEGRVLVPPARAANAVGLEGRVLVPPNWAADASILVRDVLVPEACVAGKVRGSSRPENGR